MAPDKVEDDGSTKYVERQRPFLFTLSGSVTEAECSECYYQKFEGEYLFATSNRATAESEDVGQTLKVEDGKCSRAWIENDSRREPLVTNVSCHVLHSNLGRKSCYSLNATSELTQDQYAGTRRCKI